MHYVCIEDNKVISILNYQPNVPNTVSVVQVSDQQNQQIVDGTHYFDVATRTVVPMASSALTQKEQDTRNGVEREFLNRTDWKVLRHIRQKALGIPTSLTDQQYLELEQQRQAAAARIV